MSDPLAAVAELARLSGLPDHAVRARLDQLGPGYVVRVAGMRLVPRGLVPEVVKRLQAAPFVQRPRTRIAEAMQTAQV